MWCPQCGAEFRAEIARCPDCERPLVVEQPVELLPPEPSIPVEAIMVCELCGREYEAHQTLCLDCNEALTRAEAPPRGEITGGRLPRDLMTRDPDRERARRRSGDMHSVLRHTLGQTAGGLQCGVDPEGDLRRPDPELEEKTALAASFRSRPEAEAVRAVLLEGGIESVVYEERFVDLPAELASDLEPFRVFVRPEDLLEAGDLIKSRHLRDGSSCPACGHELGASASRCPACGLEIP
jgi:hypothetical protein